MILDKSGKNGENNKEDGKWIKVEIWIWIWIKTEVQMWVKTDMAAGEYYVLIII